MRIHKKTTAVISLAAASALVLAGCSSNGDKKDDPSKEPASTSEATSEDDQKTDDANAEEEFGDPNNPITIKYLHRLPDKEGMVLVQQSFERFMKEHPGIKVEATKFDGKAQESYAKIHQSVAAGDGLCLAQVGYGEIGSEFVAGDLLDVSEFSGKYEKNYAGAPMAQMKVGNAVVGLPQDTGPLIYMYDTKAFADLGIELPKTWDEFYEAAKKARAAGKYIGSFQTDEAQYLMSGQVAAAGGSWFEATDAGWKVDFAGDATKQVADVYQKLIDEDLIKVVPRWDESFNKAVEDGELIGTVGAGWEPAFFLGKAEQTTWEVAQLPAFNPDKPSTGADGGSGVAVIKGCEHPEAALFVANWYNTQIEDLVSQGLVVAANTGDPVTPENIVKQWNGQDVYKVLAEANAAMNADFAYSPTWPAVGAELNKQAGTVKKGGTSVMDMFTSAGEVAVKSLEDANIPVVK